MVTCLYFRCLIGRVHPKIIDGLSVLNNRRIPFVLSYDGSCGDKSYGEPLPQTIARRILLDVGRSSQATLNGRDDVTIESLYVSHILPAQNVDNNETVRLQDFDAQAVLFA